MLGGWGAFFGDESGVFGFGHQPLLSGGSVAAEIATGVLVVVVVAGSSEVGEFGAAAFGDGNVVVDLQMAADFTAEDGAHGVFLRRL